MSKHSSRALRGGIRAAIGLVVVGAAATAVLLLDTITLPSLARSPIATTVDIAEGGDRILVCAGSFAELGTNLSDPGAAYPTGRAELVTSGEVASADALTREHPGGEPEVLHGPRDRPLAAAQSQLVTTEALRGRTAVACTEPSNDQWLVGGSTIVGSSTTLNLSNPGRKPATVQLSVFDENGPLDAAQTSGVLVPAGSERIISLNGYAPERERLAVHVVSTGAAVTATLGIGQALGLQPYSVDVVSPQFTAAQALVIPGVTNPDEDDHHGPSDVDHADRVPVMVRVLSATGVAGEARIEALFPDGRTEHLGTLQLEGSAVAELRVPGWPSDAAAVVVTADVPIVGGALGSAAGSNEVDNAWFAPAPEIPAGVEVAAAVVPDGRLVLVNPGGADANVTVSDAEDSRLHQLAAHSVIIVAAAPSSLIVSDAPLYAAVRVLDGGDLAAYPVQVPRERSGSLTVYTR